MWTFNILIEIDERMIFWATEKKRKNHAVNENVLLLSERVWMCVYVDGVSYEHSEQSKMLAAVI